MKKDEIEPKILPLVKAINETNLFKTFSSCQGHYEEHEQDQYMNRNRADVRFDPLDSTSLEKTEHFITYLMTEFNNQHGFVPIILSGYKLFMPNDNYESDFTFVIELEPFEWKSSPSEKRRDTDNAVLQAAKIVEQYS